MASSTKDTSSPPTNMGRSATSTASFFQHDPTYSVRVMKDDFKFNAAHFVAYKGFRERLHGHNYLVGIELWSNLGRPGEDGYVLDFGVIKKLLRSQCKALHEHFLCPCNSDVLDISYSEDGQNLQIRCEDKAFFSFPRGDCAELPLAHSTVEELAKMFSDNLLEQVEPVLVEKHIQRIEVTVTEAPGQSACYSCSAAAASR